jgi:hypothetical protein
MQSQHCCSHKNLEPIGFGESCCASKIVPFHKNRCKGALQHEKRPCTSRIPEIFWDVFAGISAHAGAVCLHVQKLHLRNTQARNGQLTMQEVTKKNTLQIVERETLAKAYLGMPVLQ